MRTFVAVNVNPFPGLLNTLKELKSELAPEAIKWVDENNLHLTLKFLGDTSVGQVDEIKNALQEITRRFATFYFRLNGLGFFKTKGMPRVLFVKIEEAEMLRELAAEIDEQLARLGFEKENRPFSPHLTLARIKFLKNKKRFFQAVENQHDLYMDEVPVSNLIFYQSILNPQGPVYKPLKIFELNGPGGN